MSLTSLKQITKTISFRLTVWYATLFILSGLVLFGLTYALLASSLRHRDRDSILLKLRDLAAHYQLAGLESLKKELAVQEKLQQTRSFFIHFAAPSDATLLMKMPDRRADFDVRRLERRVVTGTEAWIQVPAKDDEEVLEIASMRLPDGSLLQVGKSTEERDELLIVEDTGVGISPEELPNIWDRLYRGDHSRSQRGLGLGLSVVKAVVQATAAALAQVPGTVLKAELDDESGNLVYSIEIVTNTHEIKDVKVNAGNGNILHVGADDQDEEEEDD